jgi:CheY-like chemotaxis protein
MHRALKCMLIGSDADWIGSGQTVLVKDGSLRMRAISFSDSLLALDFLLHEPVDVVVADLLMPQVHGLLFVEAVRQFGFNFPVIIVSNEGSIRAEALASGANAFLAKADVPTELMPLLKQLVSPAHRDHPALA